MVVSGSGDFTCTTAGTCASGGQCVLSGCRDAVASFHDRRCKDSPTLDTCRKDLNPCQVGGESCKLLACVDETMGAATDNRVEMIGR